MYNWLKEIFKSYWILKVSDIYDKDNNEDDILNKIKSKFPSMYIEGEEPWDKLEYIFNEMLAQEYREKRAKVEKRKWA